MTGILFWTSLGSLVPTLPLYLSDLGATDQQVGQVMGAFAVGLLGGLTLLVGELGRSPQSQTRVAVGHGGGDARPSGLLERRSLLAPGSDPGFPRDQHRGLYNSIPGPGERSLP